MGELTEQELQVLRVANGEDVPGFFWGGWVTACLETLVGRGLVTRGPRYVATLKGRDLLAARDGEKG